MSGNTNTLFWVITGAVVVLGVFLLTQNNGNNNVRNINDKFSNYFDEANVDPNLKKYYSHVDNYKDLHITDESLFVFDTSTQTITSYNGTESNLVIPYEINGVEVKKIGNLNLAQRYRNYEECQRYVRMLEFDPDNTSIQTQLNRLRWQGYLDDDNNCIEQVSIESVVFPNTITEIGERAFFQNRNLTSVYLSPNTEIIGAYAFDSCNLKSLDLSYLTKLTYLGGYSFSSNDIHGGIIIPNTIENMEECTFEYNQIEYAVIPKNLVLLPRFSFRNNSALKYAIFLNDDMELVEKYYGNEYTFTMNSDFIVYVPTGSLDHYLSYDTLENYNVIEKDYPEYE